MLSATTTKRAIKKAQSEIHHVSKSKRKSWTLRDRERHVAAIHSAKDLLKTGTKPALSKNHNTLTTPEKVKVNRYLLGSEHPLTRAVPAVSQWLNDEYRQRLQLAIDDNESEAQALVHAEYRLNQRREFLIVNGFNCTWDDERLREFAEKQAHYITKTVSKKRDLLSSLFLAELHIDEFHIPLLTNKKYSDESKLARYTCQYWWRRQLRKLQGQRIEQLARDLSLIGGKAHAQYCTDLMLNYKRIRQIENDELLKNLIAVANYEDGTEDWVNIYEAAQASVSNPVNRAAELMTRIRGTEEACRELGYIGEFVTLTAPSRFHSTRKDGKPNPRYQQGLSARDAHKWFSDIWKKVRAQFAKHDISPIGYRVVEPHHDGCPHWHMLLFIRPEWQAQFRGYIEQYYLADSPKEYKDPTTRCKIIAIDPNKGSAAGYIAKYITKGVNGQHITEAKDATANTTSSMTPDEAAQRIKVNLTINGIRQFQPIGQPPVSIYRELRRLGKAIEGQRKMAYQLNDLNISDLEHFAIEALRRAADAGDWQAFCMAMGGIEVKRKDQKARIVYRTPKVMNEITQEIEARLNKYGEEPADRISGVDFEGINVLTRTAQFKVFTKQELQAANSKIMQGVAQIFDTWEQIEAFERMADEQFELMQTYIDMADSYDNHLWVFDDAVLTTDATASGGHGRASALSDLCH